MSRQGVLNYMNSLYDSQPKQNFDFRVDDASPRVGWTRVTFFLYGSGCSRYPSPDFVMFFLYERPDGSQFTSSIPPSRWGKLSCSRPDGRIHELQWSAQDIIYLDVEFEVPKELIPSDYEAMKTFDTFPATDPDGHTVLVFKASPDSPAIGCIQPSKRQRDNDEVY